MDGELQAEMLPLNDSISPLVRTLRGLLQQARDFLGWLFSLVWRQPVMIGQHRCHLVSLIAEGGFGFVWLAKDAQSGRHYACKEVLCQVPEQRTILRKEIEVHDMFSRRRHANVVPLVDYAFHKVGAHEKGVILLPLLGRSLQDVLNQRLAIGGSGFFAEPAILRIGVGVARALRALHDRGRCHRDVCPRNILLREPRDGPGRCGARDDIPTRPHPMLTDFGSAAPVRVYIGTRADAARLAEEAAQFSSPPYRAPELWSTDPGGEPIGSPADVFSLGCTLYACAFGLGPFESVRNNEDGKLRVVEPSHVRVLAPVHFPASHRLSRPFADLLLSMVSVEAGARPALGEVEALCTHLLGTAGGDAQGMEDDVEDGHEGSSLDDSFV